MRDLHGIEKLAPGAAIPLPRELDAPVSYVVRDVEQGVEVALYDQPGMEHVVWRSLDGYGKTLWQAASGRTGHLDGTGPGVADNGDAISAAAQCHCLVMEESTLH